MEHRIRRRTHQRMDRCGGPQSTFAHTDHDRIPMDRFLFNSFLPSTRNHMGRIEGNRIERYIFGNYVRISVQLSLNALSLNYQHYYYHRLVNSNLILTVSECVCVCTCER